MKEHMKSIAVFFGLTIAGVVFALATTSLFFYFTQNSPWVKKDYFEFYGGNMFPEGGDMGPGESKSVNFAFTSDATVDAYAVVRVVMPLAPAGTYGLYSLSGGSGWSQIENGVVGDRWVEVYRYDAVLVPGGTTSPLATTATMSTISRAEYAMIDDINVEVNCYACGTEDTDDAWSAIRDNYGL